MLNCFGLRAKTYRYLTDDCSEDKTAKGINKCVIKIKIKFSSYENFLEANQLDNKEKYLEKRWNQHR